MKTTFRKISMLIIAIGLILTVTACNDSVTSSNILSSALSNTVSTEKVSLNVVGLKGPTGMGMAKLMSDSEAGTTANNYKFNLYSAPDEISALIIKGDCDIAAIPTNLASVLYQKNGGLKVVALNTLGVLYMLENGNTINDVKDLKGKTIYATGQGSTPEYILNHILKSNGIDPAVEVVIEYKTEHSELATLMAAGNIVLGMLPEPNVTVAMSQNPDIRIALNLTEEWNKISETTGDNSALTQGCIVVRTEVLEKNPEAVAKFLEEYKASIDFTNQNVDEASTLIEKYGIISKAALAKKAIPNSNITYIDGDELKIQLIGFLKVLFDAKPASIGGAMPDDAFYYKK